MVADVANTAEMRHLMLLAADLLDKCDPMANAAMVEEFTSRASVRHEATDRAVAEVAAIATARTVLRMVAAAVAEDPTPTPTFAVGNDPCPRCGLFDGRHDLMTHLGLAKVDSERRTDAVDSPPAQP